MTHFLTGALDVFLVTKLQTDGTGEVDRNMTIKS